MDISKRWHKKHNHNQIDLDIGQSSIVPCCMVCKNYVKLDYPLGYDWEVCTGEKSDFDKQVVYENDNCKDFDMRELED